MLDVSRVLSNPKLNQSFVVYRRMGSWDHGRFVETENPLPFDGVIMPANANEIMQLPEGDRVTGVMVFYTFQEIFATRASTEPGTSDQIEWNGKRYRVFNIIPYKDYGYFKSFGIMMEGK
ncbi:hypothetical protein JCM15765_03890 [Paradesulfitobacterium aromaticivorans]